MKENCVIYIVVPCYNEEEVLPETTRQLMPLLEDLMVQGKISRKSRILYVNDGSKDGTWQIISRLYREHEMVSGVNLSRNRGHQNAVLAGLMYAKEYCDAAITMDADLQDPPSLLPEMYSYIEEGYDSVATRRVTRKGEPVIRSFFARMFYKLMNRISRTEIVDGARDYRLMTRQVVDAIMSMPEYNRFTKGIFGWVGYETKWLEYENIERRKGETKWSFWKLFLYSLEGIIAFSTVPLTIASVAGVFFCLVAFVIIIVTIVRKLLFGDPTSGWPSLVCIIMMVSGVQLFCLGIVGQYLSKTYMEVKRRPIYLVREEIGGREVEG